MMHNLRIHRLVPLLLLVLMLGVADAWAGSAAPAAVTTAPIAGSWEQTAERTLDLVMKGIGTLVLALMGVFLRARLSADQLARLLHYAEIAVRAAEESAAAKGLAKAGARKFVAAKDALKARFPRLPDEDLHRAIDAVLNRVDGAGASGVTRKS